jgi:3-oxoacyl-[acyl-carrier protein] reductase
MLELFKNARKPADATKQAMTGLKGKVAVVSGSSRGIGAAIAKALAGAGAKTVVTSTNERACSAIVDEITKTGGEAWCAACDVADEDQVKSLIGRAVERYGAIDIMVNNAGVYQQKSVLETEAGLWRRMLAVNLDGVFFGTKHAALQMKNRGWGRIINISSIAGVRGFRNRAAYCAAKAGVLGLTRAAAADLGQYGITVNAICPGVIGSRMTEAFINDTRAIGNFLKTIAIKRVGLPEDVANAALFLAGDGAGYITGETIMIDGGWNAHL